MKTYLILFLCLLTGISSCKKDDENSADYRDFLVGEYIGIRVNCQAADIENYVSRDTSEIQINLTKSESDSIINIRFNPGNSKYSFRYSNGNFISTQDYHSPELRISGIDLYFYYQPSPAPVWTECFAKKVQ